METILNQTIRRAFEETQAVLNSDLEFKYPSQWLTRLVDVARSNAFLFAEAGLLASEKASRYNQYVLLASRSSVLATVSADIYAGYNVLKQRSQLWPGAVSSTDWQLQHARGANRLLDTAGSLGGALIKACQFASTRSDLIPAIYIQKLSRLQDRVPPHRWEVIEPALVEEFGKPLEEIFSRFEHEPVAAASLSQVHRAWLLDGQLVAVKVRYPEIASLIAVDLKVMELLLSTITGFAPDIQLKPILDFLKDTLPLELDLNREAQALTRLKDVLQARSDVVIPAPLTEISTSRVLVMDYIEGIKINDRERLLKANISPGEVARLLNEVYADQIFNHNILHGDPHPGNILVQPGPRLVLLDHGLSVSLDPALVQNMRDMVNALMTGDFTKLSEALVRAGLELEGEVDLPALLQLVGVLLGGEGERAGNMLEVGKGLSKSIGKIPVQLLLIGRALGMLDGITKQLDPDVDALEIVASYI